MTLPPHGSSHHEVRRRIAGCRERLRKTRSAQKESGRGGARGAGQKESAAADDDAEGDETRTGKRPRR